MQFRLSAAQGLAMFLVAFLLMVSCSSSAQAQDLNRPDFNLDEPMLYDVVVKKASGGHRYGFGLGKRSPEPLGNQASFFEEPVVSGYKRRQYNFGLGKRPWPQNGYEEYRKRKYNFGLGKRTSD